MSRRKLLGLMLILALIVILVSGCGPGTETRTGKLVGVQASFSFDEAIKGEIEQMDFWGVVIIELDDGSEVYAVVDEELAQVLRGGDMVVIEAVEGSEMWKVVELAD